MYNMGPEDNELFDQVEYDAESREVISMDDEPDLEEIEAIYPDSDVIF